MSSSRENGARGSGAGSADASMYDFNKVLSRIENYVIGITNEVQTLNQRLEDYGKQIDQNSQSIANIKKTLRRKGGSKYRQSSAVCHGIRRKAGRTTHKRVNNSNALGMIDGQHKALENRLSTKCIEREKDRRKSHTCDDVPEVFAEDNGTSNAEYTLPTSDRDNLATSDKVLSEEHTARAQRCRTSQYHDTEYTESSHIGDIQTIANVEPPGNEKKGNTNVRENEIPNTANTNPSTASYKASTSDLLLSDVLITTEQEIKTSQNQETNSTHNTNGPTSSSLDTTEELAAISQDEGTSHYQDTKSSNIKDVQTTSSVESTGEQATHVQGNETSNREDTRSSNDLDDVVTSDVSPSDVLLSEDLITTEPGYKTSQNQETNSTDNTEGLTASSVDITGELTLNSQDKETLQYEDPESLNIKDTQSTSRKEPTEEQVTDMPEDETYSTEDTSRLNGNNEVATSDVSLSDVLLSEDLITTDPDDKTSQNQETNSANTTDGLTASSIDTTEELAVSSQDKGTVQNQDTESVNNKDAQTTSSKEPADFRGNETSCTMDKDSSKDRGKVAASDVLLSEDLKTAKQDNKTLQNQETNSTNNTDCPTASSEGTTEISISAVQDNETSRTHNTGPTNVSDGQAASKRLLLGNTRVNGESHQSALPSGLHSQIIPPKRLSSFNPLALGENCVFECDHCVPSEASVHLAKNRKVWKLFVFGDYNIEDGCKIKAMLGNNSKKQSSNTNRPTVTSRVEFLHLHQITKSENSNDATSSIKQREDVVRNIRGESPDLHQQTKSDIEDKSASRTRHAEHLTPERRVDSSDFEQQIKSNKTNESASSIKPRAYPTPKCLDELSDLHRQTKADKGCESTSCKAHTEYSTPKRDVDSSDFDQQTKSNKTNESASSIKPRAFPPTPKRLAEFSDFRRPTNADKGCESASRKAQTEYLTFKLEREFSDRYFRERTNFEERNESTSRVIQRDYISPSIRGDFSNSNLLNESDEEEEYAPRKKQTGDLSHLVSRDHKNMIEKMQREYDDCMEKNRRRGTFG